MKLNRSPLSIFVLIFLCNLIHISPVTAQVENNPIITAVPFLRVVQDARSAAMGDAGIGLSPDANAIQINSSRLAFAKNVGSVSLNYTPWLQALALNDVFFAYAGGYYSLDDKQTVGGSIRYFSLGNLPVTDITGDTLRTNNAHEFEFALSYNRLLGEKFALGITPKYIYSKLASGQFVGTLQIVPAISIAFDISGSYTSDFLWGRTKGNLMIGAALSNLGYKVSYTGSVNRDYIPANLGLGAAMQLNLNESNAITFAMDLNKLLVPTPSSESSTNHDKETTSFEGALKSFGDAPGGFSEELNEIMYSFGIEYLLKERYAIRAGYYTEHETKGGRQYFTTGAGVKFNIFELNLSYLLPKINKRNPLDNTFRFSLLLNFGNREIEAG